VDVPRRQDRAGESPEEAAVREVLEEAGLRVRATGLIGSRMHPRTGVEVIYVIAVPADEADAAAGEELAEVRWAGLAEAEDLIVDMFTAVRGHLRGVLDR
jgi:8-oxo-dGTP diphosphatase